MTQGQTGWLFLLILSICLFIIGMQGSLGVFIAIIFSPSAVTTSETGTAISAVPTWQSSANIIGALNAVVTAANSGVTTPGGG